METTGSDSEKLEYLIKKYEEEKVKRLRQDGNKQYIDLELDADEYLARLIEDPWVDHDALNEKPPNLKENDDIKFLVLGAGLCGLLYAVRLIEAGFKAEDIRLVDIAGGFGGTWYWNRYPGLMCDTESSIYLPLLEETGHMPTHRYSYGSDIRVHAERIAQKWNLTDSAVFRSQIEKFTWDDDMSRWIVTLKQDRGPKEQSKFMTIQAQFVILANGIINHPKTPKLEGLEDFDGDMIHTSRWKYEVSGGSPADWTLNKLKGKKVGFIGTGATGVQCITELAKWADQLYVFQRTPASIDIRGQREMDPKTWKDATAQPGWWTARNKNFVECIVGANPKENLIGDSWTTINTYDILIGAPSHDSPLQPQDVQSYITRQLTRDAHRAERLRQRVKDTVTKDKDTAESLLAWYPSWCKRPCFHDEYLDSFNKANVHLVQTEPTGVGKATRKGIIANGREYELDVLVFATGYRSPGANRSDPSKMCNATIVGRNGRTVSDKWLSNGPETLHGLMTNGFPNLFLTGPTQAAASPSITFLFDIMAQQAAYIVSEATRRCSDPSKMTIEASKMAEDAWTDEIIRRKAWVAPMAVCLPSYLNNEGVSLSEDEASKSGKGMSYPLGINSYASVLEDWRREGKLDGLEVIG